MGYNDVILCGMVIKSDERVLFHWTGSISSDKSDRTDCWLWMQPISFYILIDFMQPSLPEKPPISSSIDLCHTVHK